jgi:hypothetical protein
MALFHRTSLNPGEFILAFHLPKRPPRSADASHPFWHRAVNFSADAHPGFYVLEAAGSEDFRVTTARFLSGCRSGILLARTNQAAPIEIDSGLRHSEERFDV